MITNISNTIKKWGNAIFESSNSTLYFFVALIVILGPFFFIPVRGMNVIAGKGFIFALLACLLVIIGGIAILKKGSVSIPKTPFFLVLLGLSFASLLGAIFSPKFSMALIGYGFETTTWLFITMFGIFSLLAYKVVQGYQRTGILFGGLFIAFLLLALHHVIRFFIGPEVANLGVLGSATSTLIGSWNDLSIFTGLVLLIAVLTLELAGMVRFAKYFLVVVSVIALVFLLAINYVVVWIILGLLSLLAMLYLFAFAYWDKETKSFKKDRKMPWFLLTLFVVSVVALFFGGFVNRFVGQYQSLAQNDIRPSFTSTFRVAEKSFVHNPVLGYGPNSFSLAWSLAKPPVLSGNRFGDIDFSLGYSYITSQIATQGALGLILWLALLIVFGIYFFKRMNQGFEHWLDRYTTVTLGSAVVFLLIISIVSIPGSYLLVLLAILMGAFVGIGRESQAQFSLSFIKDPRASFFGISGLTILIILLCAGGYEMTRKTLAFVSDTRGLVLIGEGKVPEGTRLINQAVNLSGSDIFHTQLAGLALRDAQVILNQAGTAANRQVIAKQAEQALGIALGHAKAAVDANPLNYKNWIVLGNVYRTAVTLGVTDAYSLAQKAYDEARARNPQDATMQLAYANLDLINKDNTKALESIKQSIDTFPTKDAYLLRAQIEILQQRWSAVVSSLQQAIILDQQDAPLYVYLGVAYEKSGDTEKANALYSLIRNRFTDGDDVIAQVRKVFFNNPAINTDGIPDATVKSPAAQTTTPAAPKKK